MVTNSSSVPNTSTVLATTLKSIGKSIVKFFDFGQYVKRLDGINTSQKCLAKIIAIECHLDQAVFLQDIMDCADEQLSVYNSSPSVFSDVIVSTKYFTPDGKAKLVGGKKVNLHESILFIFPTEEEVTSSSGDSSKFFKFVDNNYTYDHQSGRYRKYVLQTTGEATGQKVQTALLSHVVL
jgi:hypothetical protein